MGTEIRTSDPPVREARPQKETETQSRPEPESKVTNRPDPLDIPVSEVEEDTPAQGVPDLSWLTPAGPGPSPAVWQAGPLIGPRGPNPYPRTVPRGPIADPRAPAGPRLPGFQSPDLTGPIVDPKPPAGPRNPGYPGPLETGAGGGGAVTNLPGSVKVRRPDGQEVELEVDPQRLRQGVVIGRADPMGVHQADLPIEGDPFISREHTRLRQDDQGRILVEDLGSKNGTWVREGEDVWRLPQGQEFILNERQSLELGQTQIMVRPGDPGSGQLETVPMNRDYQGEHLPNNHVWPGHQVTYLTPEQRQAYRVTVDEQGRLRDSRGLPLDTRGSSTNNNDGAHAIYVMDSDGNLYVSKYQRTAEFHHSSLLAGQPVAGAGEIHVEQGRIRSINNKSGHYTPPGHILDQTVRQLDGQGADLDQAEIRYHR